MAHIILSQLDKTRNGAPQNRNNERVLLRLRVQVARRDVIVPGLRCVALVTYLSYNSENYPT